MPSLDYTSELARVRFVTEVVAHGLVHVAHDRFRGDGNAAAIAELGRPELIRSNAAAGELEAFVWLPGNQACLIDVGHGRVELEVAGCDAGAVEAALTALRTRLHRAEPPPTAVPFAFWLRGKQGGEVRHRDIDIADWAAARRNYPRAVARALDRLMTLREPASGRLVVWRGEPGTGKTWALRALAGAWRDWCSVHYVLDPQTLMSSEPRYLLDVLAWRDEDAESRWRLLVLEDAGELIVHDAGRTGALASLLNLTDGILGQGSRTVILVTTNEPVAHLHPAVRRRGRCLADIEFGRLTRDEARRWLERAGSAHEPDRPLTLAELYALIDGGDSADEPLPTRPTFGFSRALGG